MLVHRKYSARLKILKIRCFMLQVLREREAYLRQRVIAKQKVGWEFRYDLREQTALAWAIRELGGEPLPDPDVRPE